MPDVPPSRTETQAQRRVKYGLNVAVVAIIAAVLCVLINVICAWSLSDGRAQFDFTRTRSYSLSEQTRKALRELQDDYRIVTIVNDSGEEIDQASSLVNLYGQFSSHIKVEQLHPSMDLGRLDVFYKDLRARYKDQLDPLEHVVQQGLAALASFRRETAAHAAKFRAIVQDPSVPEDDAKRIAGNIASNLTRLDAAKAREDERKTREEIEQKLPDYQAAVERLRDSLTAMDAVSGLLTTQLDDPAKKTMQAEAAPAIKVIFADFREMLAQQRAGLEAALKGLQEAKPAPEYSDIVTRIHERNPFAVVVMGPQQTRVLDIRDMFIRRSRDAEPAAKPERAFQGEEKITGALVSMMLKQPPLVVFVNPGSDPVLGPQGSGAFNQVAQRLRTMNFRVEQWSPMPHAGPEGSMVPPESPPQPAVGQKAIWILLPSFQPGFGEMTTAEYVKKRQEAGDPVMLQFAVVPEGRGSPGGGAAVQLASQWGIEPQTDSLILREVTASSGRPYPSPRHEVEAWSKDHPITRALAGMRGVFIWASPLNIVEPKATDQLPKTTIWPLVTIAGTDLWAEAHLDQEMPKRDPKTAKDSYVIAVAAQRGDKRMVVFGDARWAIDSITTNASPSLDPRYMGSAEAYGAAYPANAELFVNSIYWLAGLDQLIAASPRTQDVRRIQHQFDIIHRLWLGLILVGAIATVTTATGVGVWLVRRKS